jgi:hypothetical protein
MKPVPSSVTKSYPPRGPLQQFRFAEATAFRCLRCGSEKKSKLITVYGGEWDRRLCNGCYGRLLALYEIKAGVSSDDERVDELASALLSAVTMEDQRRAERLFRAAEQRADRLCPAALRFVATAEYVAEQLHANLDLEWSPAIIGLCKAAEAEVVARILRPLASVVRQEDLSTDRNDKDVGRVAVFCTDPNRKPPELGAVAHFLQTAAHSKERRNSSVVIRAFLRLAAKWPGSNWLLDPSGFHQALTLLSSSFRNRAAHVDELSKDEYLGCRELVIGADGFLWKLVLSTESTR